MIRQSARDFAVRELLPGVIERDDNAVFPASTDQNACRTRLPRHDGRPEIRRRRDGLPFLTSLAMEEISKTRQRRSRGDVGDATRL
ncbi:MAG: hypothetical protein MZV63_41415 [Marinilabiliales bacterium]|nr:hypothetical protein [Marinilabiliales bacterium]